MWKILLNSIILTWKLYLKFFINQRHIIIMINMWNLSWKNTAILKCPWSHVISRYIVSQELFYTLKWCANTPYALYYTCGLSGEWRKLFVLSNKHRVENGFKWSGRTKCGPQTGKLISRKVTESTYPKLCCPHRSQSRPPSCLLFEKVILNLTEQKDQ